MKDFIAAALPWVLIASAVAIFVAVNYRQSQRQKNGENVRQTRMNEGACFGICVGIAMGTSDVMGLPLAIGMGMLMGEVLGMCLKKKDENEKTL